MADQDLLDKIDAYLQGRLSAEDAGAFEAEIRKDPALAAEVDAQRVTLAALDRMFILQMKEKARAWREAEEEPEPPPAVVPPARRFPAWILGLGLLLLLAGAFWFWNKRDMEQRELARQTEQRRLDSLERLRRDRMTRAEADSLLRVQQAREAEIRDSLARITPEMPVYAALAEQEWDRNAAGYGDIKRAGAEPGTENVLEAAGKAIDKKEYRKAERLLEGVPAGDKAIYPRALEMLAYVYARLGRVDKAVATYKRYMIVSQNSDRELVDWTLMHYYLAEYPRYKAEVKRLLAPMLKPGHDFQADAVEVKAALVKAGLW